MERKAFGKPIAEFGLIQEKLAERRGAYLRAKRCATGLWVQTDAALADVDKNDNATIQKRIADYAVGVLDCEGVGVEDVRPGSGRLLVQIFAKATAMWKSIRRSGTTAMRASI